MKLKYILATIALGLFGQGYACKCGGPGTVKESFRTTDVIIYGKVISKDTVALSETIREENVEQIKEDLKDDKQQLRYFEMTYVLKIELEIVEKYKGNNLPTKVVIYTPMLSATCGYRFEKGKEYIVYASKENFLAFLFQKQNDNNRHEQVNTFWTTHCTRTTEYAKLEADELKILSNKIE